MRELFIYYRSEELQADRILQVVGDFQARLALQTPSLRARLLRRPELQSERITWMETYSIDDAARHPDGVDERLLSMIETAAQELRALIDGPRHVEVFESCAS